MVSRKTRYGIALMTVLAAITYWATRQQQGDVDENPAQFDIKVDYALSEFEMLYFDQLGKPALKLTSPSFKSDSETGNGLVASPVLEINHNGYHWNIIADSATITEEQDFVYLNGAVTMDRSGALPADWLEIQARQVTLEIEPRIASSSFEMESRDLSGRMSATGFTVNMTTNEFSLLQDVHVVYVLP